MYVTGETLDDILLKVFTRLLKKKPIAGPARGSVREIVACMLRLRNPRARLSRSAARGHVLFSSLGEFFWMMSGSDALDFIYYYIREYRLESEDGATVHGAYGPRIRGGGDYPVKQLDNIGVLLRDHPVSRRAVIQLLSPFDLDGPRKREIPCTTSLQFLVRRNRLHLITTMRSNDAFRGLPHDVFVFTMLQEYMARALGIEPGTYSHVVGSLHLYETKVTETGDEIVGDVSAAEKYVNERWQDVVPMPPMPMGHAQDALQHILAVEAALREGRLPPTRPDLEPYWQDIARALETYAVSIDTTLPDERRQREIEHLRSRMSSRFFDLYLLKRQRNLRQADPPMLLAPQLRLFPRGSSLP